MAFAITQLANEVCTELIGIPVASLAATGGPADATASEADITVGAATTTNSTVKNVGVACRWAKAIVYLKTLAGASTLEVKLQMSSSATFAADVVTVDEKFMNAVVAGSGNVICWTLFGQVPTTTGEQYLRIQFVTGSGTSGTADVIYYAT